MGRVVALFGFAIALALAPAAQAQDKIGVVLLHGKQTPAPTAAGLGVISSSLEGKGAVVVVPSMAWGAGWQTINITVEDAFAQIDGYVAQLRAKGASRIVVGGHSLGANVALSYAVNRGNVAGVVMAAAGHNPRYSYSSNETIRKDIDRAAELVKAGQGGQSFTGRDSNQGSNITMTTTAAVYLSWMNSRGLASMQVQAPNLPASVPILVVMGEKDPGIGFVESQIYKPAAKNPYSKYLTNGANHVQTAEASSKQIVDWIVGLPK